MAERRAYTPFDRARFQRRLPCGVALGQKLLVLDQTESTQTALRAELDRLGSAGRGLIVLAEEQRAGRGRTARDWWSGPPSANLAVSVAVHALPDPVETLGMHAACALVGAAAPYARGRQLALKWPNDLLLDGAKFAGLLVEAGLAGRRCSASASTCARPRRARSPATPPPAWRRRPGARISWPAGCWRWIVGCARRRSPGPVSSSGIASRCCAPGLRTESTRHVPRTAARWYNSRFTTA